MPPFLRRGGGAGAGFKKAVMRPKKPHAAFFEPAADLRLPSRRQGNAHAKWIFLEGGSQKYQQHSAECVQYRGHLRGGTINRVIPDTVQK